MLVIDAANVIGSRPTGWWRDRAGAARTFVDQVRGAAGEGRLPSPVVVVLEGAARGGAPEEDAGGVRVVHARGSGDDAIVAQAAGADPGAGAGAGAVVVVTADRQLRARVQALGAEVEGPRWLDDRLRSRSGPSAPLWS